jgi:hypothetical protein
MILDALKPKITEIVIQFEQLYCLQLYKKLLSQMVKT